MTNTIKSYMLTKSTRQFPYFLMYHYCSIYLQKKHQYSRNFFENSCKRNMRGSEYKFLIFNFPNKNPKYIYVFMIRKDYNLIKLRKLQLILILLFPNIFFTLHTTWPWVSNNTKFIRLFEIFKKL